MGAITSGTAAAAGEPAATDAGWAATAGRRQPALPQEQLWVKALVRSLAASKNAARKAGRQSFSGRRKPAERGLLPFCPARRRTCCSEAFTPSEASAAPDRALPSRLCHARWSQKQRRRAVARRLLPSSMARKHRTRGRCQTSWANSLPSPIPSVTTMLNRTPSCFGGLDHSRSFKRTESKLSTVGQGRHDSD